MNGRTVTFKGQPTPTLLTDHLMIVKDGKEGWVISLEDLIKFIGHNSEVVAGKLTLKPKS